MWRYREVMPVESDDNIVSLGEGWTPLLRSASDSATQSEWTSLLIKDESLNPTQSFKARGMSAAVSMAKELGVKKLAAPSAGNAAARSPRTLLAPEWRRTSSCRATRRARTSSNASRPVRT